jgi:hypothetical protein
MMIAKLFTSNAAPIGFLLRSLALSFLVACANSTRAGCGADIPWTTYEAEEMKTTGSVLGPKYAPFLVETESSHQKCVKLAAPGEFVEFTAQAQANAMIIRYNLPDSAKGGGINGTLRLTLNGKLLKLIPISSHSAWLYGNYPFSNLPKEGKPRNFYTEVRLKALPINQGDTLRLEKTDDGASSCIIDLVDLEQAAPPLSAPAQSISVLEFGASGAGEVDDTASIRKCIATAHEQGKTVWVPPGIYKITGDLLLPSGIKIQGAGMWHTVFAGDPELYEQADKRVRFKLQGTNIHLADFAIDGKLNYRNDNEPNDGIVGADCGDSSITRIWVEHTKVGAWFYNASKLVVEGCRFRNTLADGVNFCVGTRDSVVQNCTSRGTGDDCFAMWPAPSDQGFIENAPSPGSNVFRRCTGQLTFLANGGAIYGGANNRIEDCAFTDISTGCGILLSTTFPTSDESLRIDNNFSGTTVVRNCDLVRCGGYDHGWAWRGAFQLCMDRRSISGVAISNINIKDSMSDGLTIVAPGSKKGQGTLSNVRLENVNVSNCGIGADSRHGLWVRNDASGTITLVGTKIADVKNSSDNFTMLQE